MKRLKKIIIVLIVIFIILLICTLVLCKSAQKYQEEDLQEAPDISGDFIKKLGIVEDHNTYFSVEKMLTDYIKKIEFSNNIAIYNLMDTIYILEKAITQENVLEHIANILPYASEVRIRKMYDQKNADNAVYYIDCILEKNHEGKEFYFILYEDIKNSTYSVAQIDKETYEKKIISIDQEVESKTIEKNDYNKTPFINPTEEQVVIAYFEDFLENVLYYPEYAYNLLDSEYKNNCFPTLQEFKEYINSKREMFLSYDITNLKTVDEFESMEEYLIYIGRAKNLELQSYQIRYKEEYNRYICIDSDGNYYTFYATSPLNYTVVLGNYAIPTEDFTETYNSSSEPEKVVLNIKRFFMGIDDKNYGYSYSVLSEAFKNNNYPTKNDFINYVKQNFFEENEIEYIKYEKENGLYIYKIKIKDATGKSAGEKELNMILKLKSGTDFEMSFGEN